MKYRRFRPISIHLVYATWLFHLASTRFANVDLGLLGVSHALLYNTIQYNEKFALKN